MAGVDADMRELVSRGFDAGLLRLGSNYGIVCEVSPRIVLGGDWFYFGGEEADTYDDAAQYMREVGTDAVTEMVAEVLSDGEGNGLADYEAEMIVAGLRESLGGSMRMNARTPSAAEVIDSAAGKTSGVRGEAVPARARR